MIKLSETSLEIIALDEHLVAIYGASVQYEYQPAVSQTWLDPAEAASVYTRDDTFKFDLVVLSNDDGNAITFAALDELPLFMQDFIQEKCLDALIENVHETQEA